MSRKVSVEAAYDRRSAIGMRLENNEGEAQYNYDDEFSTSGYDPGEETFTVLWMEEIDMEEVE